MPLLPDQPRSPKVGEVERQRRTGETERLGYRPGGQSSLARLDEKTVDREPMFLRKSGERGDGFPMIHWSRD